MLPAAPAAAVTGGDEPGTVAAPAHDKKKRKKQRRANMITDQKGTVRLVSDDVYALEPDSDTGTRYLPDALPDDLKQEGLRVVFSGQVGEIPPNVRMMGTPFTVTAIHKLE